MKIKPLNDWAVIVPSEAELMTAGGLYIPDAAREKPAEGVVEDIGPGALEEEGYGKKKKEKKDRKFVATSVRPGERVLYASYAGQKITLGSEERVLVRERDILGIMPPKAAVPKQELPPLQIPAVTSSSRETAIVRTQGQGDGRSKDLQAGSGRREGKKKAEKKATRGQRPGNAKKKTVKKAAKKAALKKGVGAGKPRKPAAGSAKKSVNKALKKTGRKK